MCIRDRCTTPSDHSQYCYESAKNCLGDCKGKEFCECADAKGAGCDTSWFVPGAKGTDKHAGVHCVNSTAPPPTPPTPPAPPSGCPGGSLTACIGLCPASPPAAYQACVANCAAKCAHVDA